MAGEDAGSSAGLQLRRGSDLGADAGALGDQAVHLFPVLDRHGDRHARQARPLSWQVASGPVLDAGVLPRRPNGPGTALALPSSGYVRPGISISPAKSPGAIGGSAR